MKDILDRITESSQNESSHELICRLRDCAHEIEALRAALACRPDAQADELASMTRMFLEACSDLGAINEALGLDPEDGGREPIIDAITELKRERDEWVDANYGADAQADEIRAADPGEELQGWSVTVERNGVRLLTIEKDSVGSVENIGDFAPLVRDCAEHLLSFIGRDAQADERGAFEAWARVEFQLPADGLSRQGDGYRYSGVCDAWSGWQARAATRQAEAPQAEAAQGVPEGWKCSTCQDGELLPQYGCAPHDCFYKIGKQIGQSEIHAADTWPDNFEVDEESAGRCGTFHCPACGPKFKAGKPIAAPSPDREQAGEVGDEYPETPTSKQAARVGVLEFHLRRIILTHEAGAAAKVPLAVVIESVAEWLQENGWKRNAVRTSADASPSRECGERQGVALSDDARECLQDVVSHHDNIVAGFAAQRLNACEAGDSDNATYWAREMNVAHRMKEQAKRALAASAPTLTDAIEALQCPDTHSCSNPELFERGYETARTAALDVLRALLANGE